ncbi:MAG: hypothetical protein JW786_12155 [Desulfobacterales bacterium]|nr:hypothetical protein [Desulfobacterales bacterium]
MISVKEWIIRTIRNFFWGHLLNQIAALENRIKKIEDHLVPSTYNLFQDPWLKSAGGIHKNERCFLLGCGPSLKNLNLSLLKNDIVMGVNGAYQLDSVKLDYFASVSHYFWKHHKNELKKYPCRRRFLPHYLNEIESDTPTSWLNLLEKKHYGYMNVPHPWFFSFEPFKYVSSGGSVIYCCLQILYYLGFRTIVLLGVDHDYGVNSINCLKKNGAYIINSTDLNAHFTSNYYRSKEQVHIDVEAMERGYKLARDVFHADGRTIINASPGTKLDVFDIKDFESFF